MAIISELVLYPIKSCAGISVRQAVLTGAGLAVDNVYDREWMVVDEAGRFLTQREYPRLALVSPRIRLDTLELRAPGMLRLEIPLGLPAPGSEHVRQVTLWDDTVPAYDCDETTATWFSQVIGVACRLVRFHHDARRYSSKKWTGGIEAPNMFSDGYPVLLTGSASLADLNGRLAAAGRAPLPMNRFRPNIVIDGLDAYEEDYVESFSAGDTVLKPVKPCARCPVPAVDQATGVPGPDPLDILQTYRARAEVDGGICFGMNCIVTAGDGQRLHVGQHVTAALAF